MEIQEGDFFWGIQPVFRKPNGDRTKGDWMGPVKFTYSPAQKRIPPANVTISIEARPSNPVADGTSFVEVTAYVRDKSGQPVVDEQVRFVSEGFSRDPDGTVFGGTDRKEVGKGYRILSSGYYLDHDGQPGSNIFTTRTDTDGKAAARFRVPQWADYMKDKPVSLGVWYGVDGGGNPYAETDVFLLRP